MKIWMFNNTCSLPEHGHFTRQYYFGKNLAEMGCEPVVFAGSHPHNSRLQLIEGSEKYKVFQQSPFPWVLVKTCNYEGSRIKRLWSMLEYYVNGKRAARAFARPDAILGSSPQPLAAVLAIRLAKKYRCRSIVEIRDLWPESIVAYGIAGANNPAVRLLRRLEKWIYTKADAIVFTMEGGKDYIVERGWDTGHGGPVDLSKVYHINNGVDLAEFDYNKEHYTIEDADLDDPDTFKVVYTGSIRKANNLGLLLDTAKSVSDPRVRFMIWGNGSELPGLRQRVADEGIGNVVFKGVVGKKYIPYITGKANLTVLNYEMHDIWKYGGSQNKLFEYFASGTPVMTNLVMGYDLIDRYHCGIHVAYEHPEAVAASIARVAAMDETSYGALCRNARAAAQDYNFPVLTKKLVSVVEDIVRSEVNAVS